MTENHTWKFPRRATTELERFIVIEKIDTEGEKKPEKIKKRIIENSENCEGKNIEKCD
jgi:hypothetical protein